MNPAESRRAARALQNAPLTPQERERIADAAELADSWATLPTEIRAQLEAAETVDDDQEHVGEQLLRRIGQPSRTVDKVGDVGEQLRPAYAHDPPMMRLEPHDPIADSREAMTILVTQGQQAYDAHVRAARAAADR